MMNLIDFKKEFLMSNNKIIINDDEYKKFLEEKGYTVSKNTYLPNNLDLLSVSALPMYYKAAKTIAKFIF